MKKFIKFISLLPVLLLSIICLWGCSCSQDRLQRISLSISSEDAIYVGGNEGYVIEYSNTPIKIQVELFPSSFSEDSLTWQSQYTNVARVNNGYITCVGEGTTIITATYKNSSQELSQRILVTITRETLPEFPQTQMTSTYSGEDQKDNFKVINSPENQDEFSYQYYNLSNGQVVNEIIDVGRYKITYNRRVTQGEGEDATTKFIEYASMNVEIIPYDILINASNGSSVFGDDLQNGFFNGNVSDDNLNEGIDITQGVGKDAGISIGKHIFTTTASKTSLVGPYSTGINYKLNDEFAKNYSISYIPGTYTITARQVILVVDDQNISYGASATLNRFKLYDYNEYVENGNRYDRINPLDNSTINYSSHVSVSSYTFMQDGEVADLNVYGYLDSGAYTLGYTNPTSDNNLSIIETFFGNLTVSKRSVMITPHDNLSKVYGTLDDLSSITYDHSGIININEIVPFISIDYISVVGSDYDLGEQNDRAPVGTYYYTINNTYNKNYTFTLDERAMSTWEDVESQIVFTVEKSNIIIQFENYEGNYSYPKNNSTHVVSYFNNSDADYILKLRSFRVNNVEQIVDEEFACQGEDFENTGNFLLNTGEVFKINLNLTTMQTDHYASYQVTLDSSEFSTGSESNFNVTVLSSRIDLNKITVTVTPNASAENSHKTYDGSQNLGGQTITNFLNSFALSDEIEDNLNIYDIIIEGTSLLSMSNGSGLFVKVDEQGNETVVNSFRDCGSYKVFLNSQISYKKGMEYYDFILDDSQNYLFTIEKYEINIIPVADQSKLYGSADPEIEYDIDENTQPVDGNVVRTGNLSRQSGEDIGTYTINLGTLSFGDNYSLNLATQVEFKIEKRQVIVEPYSYTTTYGSDNPITISYYVNIVGAYDEDILVSPQFTGEFALTKGGNIVQRIGNYYPVSYDENNDVIDYIIKQGSFTCEDENFELVVNEESTYRVNPKEITLNLIASTWEREEGIPEPGLELNYDTTSFEVVDNPVVSIKSITLTEGTGTYYILNLNNVDISITKNGVDVKDCYNISLGQNIVYYIDSQIIDFKLVYSQDLSSATAELTYTGQSMASTFRLVCTTPGFTFSTNADGESSSYSIVYSTGEEDDVTPINVGGYNVNLVLEEGDKLVLSNSQGQIIELTEFGVSQNSYIASLSQTGYLNILKAQIQYNEDLLGFASSIIYGQGQESLPNIIEVQGDQPVFTGVNGEQITLRTFDGGKNYEYRTSSYPVEMLGVAASPHDITVMVQAFKEGEVDNNYLPLTINVPLTVSPRPITINSEGDSAPTITSPDGLTSVVYSGSSRYFTLNMETDDEGNNFSIAYGYILLNAQYNGSGIGYLKKYAFDGNNVSEVLDNGNEVLVSVDEIITESTIDVYVQTIRGTNYVIIDNGNEIKDCYQVSGIGDVVPRNAGIYLCTATCTSGQNYVFSYKSENMSEIEFFEFFEIEKSSNIIIDNWKTNFYYGTIFNINNPSELPFEYSMTPDFKSSVEYVVENSDQWAQVNYRLNVNNGYNITLVVDEQNYYFASEQIFNVISCEAEVYFPAVNQFVYLGENQPVTSFLNEISAVLLNENGEALERVYYIDNPNMFNFEYYNLAGDLLDTPPFEVGLYVLKAIYGSKSDSYFGEGTFEYEIAKRAYSGTVTVSDRRAPYDPTYTASELYGIMIDMFDCDAQASEYTLKIVDDNNPDIVYSANDESWVSSVNSCASAKRLRFIVSFTDGITADREVTALLTFTRIAITDDNLSPVNSIYNFYYTGYSVYKELLYNSVNLAPSGEVGTTQIVSANDGNYSITYLANNTVSLTDNIGNLIFRIRYNYYLQSNEETGEYTLLSNPPVAPNDLQYRVEYVFEEIGTNYVRNTTIDTLEYKINKINTLYVSFSNFVETYTGEDFSNIIEQEDIVVSNNASNELSNMKITLLKSPTSSTATRYSDENGVSLVMRYMKDNEYVSEIKDAGTYQIVLSLLYSSSYDLSRFFNNICFNGRNTYSVSQFSNTSDNLTYTLHITSTFIVSQQSCPYSLENLDEVITITGTNYIEIEESTNDPILYIDDTSSFTINDGVNYTVEIYRVIGTTYTLIATSFEELPPVVVEDDEDDKYVEYALLLVDTSGNYQDSAYLRIRKLYTDSQDNQILNY